MLQIVGGPGGHMVCFPFQGKIRVHGTKIHRQVAQLLGKALPGNHGQGQTTAKGFPEDGLVQLRVKFFGHDRSPFRK